MQNHALGLILKSIIAQSFQTQQFLASKNPLPLFRNENLGTFRELTPMYYIKTPIFNAFR
jgi:hypothetical protein